MNALSPEQKNKALLPAVFLPLAIVPAFILPLLGKQPKEMTAAVFCVYIALMAVFVAALAKKKGRQGFAIGALLTCVVFTGLFVTYAFLAFSR
jgi:hypothetical protein